MKNPLLILAGCFALGILGAYVLVPDFRELPLLLAASSACLLFGLLALRQNRMVLSACLVLAGFVVAGMAASVSFQNRFPPDDIHYLADWGTSLKKSIETEGIIVNNPVRGNSSFRFDLACRRIKRDGRWRNVQGKVQVRLFIPAKAHSWAIADAMNLRYGDLIRAPVRFERPRVYRNPGSFDFRWWLQAIKDISWEGEIKNPTAVRTLAGSQASRLSMLISGMRFRLLRGIDHLYPPWSREGRVGAVLKAVLLGDRSSLDSNTVENFRQSGLYHLLVISGLHVGLLASVLLFFLYLLHVGESWRAVWLLIFLGTYALLVEQRAPTLRASLMIATYLLARYLYRDRSALNAVGLAALILLFHRPAWLFEAGFELSFSAALLIAGLALPVLQRTTFPYRGALYRLPDVDRDINLAPRMAQFRLDLRMIVGWLKSRFSFLRRHPVFCEGVVTTPIQIALWTADLMLFSAIIQIGLLMPMAETFHRITFVGIGLNTLAFPLMMVLIALAVPTVILAATVPILALLPGKLLFWVTSALLALTEFRGEPFWMSYRIPGPPVWVAVGFALAVTGIALTLGRNRRLLWASAVGFLTFAGLVVTYPFSPNIPQRMLEVTALDCGRGEALFAVLPDGATLLVDAGGRQHFGPDIGRWNPGEEIVSPYLWSRGIKKIDLAILGEGSKENLQAMLAILHNFKVGELWRSVRISSPDDLPLLEVASRRGVRIRDVSIGYVDAQGDANIQVLWPPLVYRGRLLPYSDGSPVLRIVSSYGNVLIRGGTDDRVERVLAKSGGGLSSDVLQSARALSEISAVKPFLERVNPMLVMGNVASANHRAGTVYLPTEAIGGAHVPVFIPAEDGAVTVDLKQPSLRVHCYGSSKVYTLMRPVSRARTSSGL